MSKSRSHDSTNSTATATVSDQWENIPCVQYGFPKDKGPIRSPKLRTIFEPIPDDAETASPVYGLTPEQYERQDDFEKGYEVEGYTSIATELQDECEAADQVLYPIHIESDVYHQEGPATLIEWFREFVEEYLGVPFHTCTLYFSGNRSIHVHVPRFVSGEDQREHLKELAETFCTDKGAELDCGLYYAKRMFRLPGVEHTKTGLHKVEIEPEWDHDRIIREVIEATPDLPESYEAILRRVFATQPSLTVDSPQTTLDPPYDLFRVLDSEKTVLEFKSDERDIETPLIERKDPPTDASASEMKQWTMYRAKEFSPYALASGNTRSVAVLKVKGGAFARKDVRNGTTLVPAYFYGARGCAGEEYTKADKHAPLQLSARDFQKWDYKAGDDVVIIGGQSRNSRIFRVDSWQATVAGHALTGNDASREAALDYLESEGYDVGKAGTSGKAKPSTTADTRNRTESNSQDNKETEAAKLQHLAERDGVNQLGFTETSNVANRLLQIGGWSLAWEWCETQFGEQFDPENTWIYLKGIVDCYDDLNVQVPPKPR
jgi:hypothetical protein